MDKAKLEALQKGGAKIEVLQKKGPDPDILAMAEALRAQGDVIAKTLESIAKIPPPPKQETPIVNIDVRPEGVNVAPPEVTIKPAEVTLVHPKKARLKKISFNVTKRDQMGNLVSFDAIPEYENVD